MLPTLFDELRAEGREEGREEIRTELLADKQDMVLAVLQMRFKKIPKKIESSIKRVSSAVALKSLVVKAAGCQTLGEFAAVLK